MTTWVTFTTSDGTTHRMTHAEYYRKVRFVWSAPFVFDHLEYEGMELKKVVHVVS